MFLGDFYENSPLQFATLKFTHNIHVHRPRSTHVCQGQHDLLQVYDHCTG